MNLILSGQGEHPYRYLTNLILIIMAAKTQLKTYVQCEIPEPRIIVISPYEPKFLREIETQIIFRFGY